MQYPSGFGQGSAYSLDPADSYPAATAADGQTFGDQGREVIEAFSAVYGPQEAENAWLAEHNQAIGASFAGGGTVPGAYGSAQNVTAHGGEFVLTRAQYDALAGAGAYGGGGVGGGGGGYWAHAHDIVLDGRVVGRAVEPYVTGAQARVARVGLG
jgi:hypothetical protein